MKINELAGIAKQASLELAAASTELKNNALKEIAKDLQERMDEITAANKGPLMKRLRFDQSKIQDVVEGIHSLVKLPDPVGQTLAVTELDEGLKLYKVSCPIGVIGVIFESRPDALVQISTLCLKSGNGVLLKGGSEAKETNRILTDIIIKATERAGIPTGWLQLLETRADVAEMLKMDEYIDLLIPRGSNAFVRHIMDNSRIPVLGHADGICHCYVDKNTDFDMALKVIVDAKTQYPAACNAIETVLVHEEIAVQFIPLIKQELERKEVVLYGCEKTCQLIDINAVSAENWKTEYLDYKLSLKIVRDIEEAIRHINTYGSGHTDSIITRDEKTAERFLNLVDSSSVFWNCSTRFSDGFRYGLGAEVGISTNKIHARGPVGLEGLIIHKYKLLGNGHIVEDYASRKRTFTHKKLDI